jgi:hypothetical protein
MKYVDVEDVPIAGCQSGVDISLEISDLGFVNNHLTELVMMPGCGEGALSSTDSIFQVKHAFPNLKSCGVVVSWFIDRLGISGANIKPGIEKDLGEDGADNSWEVGTYHRNNAHKIARDGWSSSSVRYGGTMPDADVINYIQTLKSSGLEAVFYPFLMVDSPGKPWRGFICGQATEVANFYEYEYKPFILHYANLLKDHKLDAFLIGSELEKLTSIMAEDYSFPFALKLKELAGDIKKLLGPDVKVSYAANWSEYHSAPGGMRPLDDLWSSPDIDFVGIDAYFPLTDHKDNSEITTQEIKKGWTSGEGVDYYYDDETQEPLSDKPWAQWKNLNYWHSTEHYNWNPVTSTSTQTPWQPGMKPIWFTEFGFSCLDKATNTPNVFSPTLPEHSTGEHDKTIQVKGIRATMEFTSSTTFIQKSFCYGFDSRGLSWQDRKVSGGNHYYSDHGSWVNGHWIDGKLGNK